jgi:hypothetical protein
MSVLQIEPGLAGNATDRSRGKVLFGVWQSDLARLGGMDELEVRPDLMFDDPAIGSQNLQDIS